MRGRKLPTTAGLCSLLAALSFFVSDARTQESALPSGVGKLAPVGSVFTYQGQIKKNGVLITGNCDLNFTLWDAAGSGSPPTGGTQIGTTYTVTSVPVASGLFTTQLGFGANAFEGDERYLQIAVRFPAASGSYKTLAPRQLITPAPYAMALRPGAVIRKTGAGAKNLSVYSNDWGGGSASIYGVMDTPSGIFLGTYAGIWGDSTNGSGLYGTSANMYGVYGKTATGDAGVFGQIGNTWTGLNTGEQAAVLGVGTGPGGIGVVGASIETYGVRGQGLTGVKGISYVIQGTGVVGECNNGVNAWGVWGKSTSGYAGYFNGNVHVAGTLSKTAGGFKIDHPLDPANKYLNHSFVESPDMKNLYDGVAVLDGTGAAVVQLPDWFEALNRDFRYQLTCIGVPAPVYIAAEISSNRFTIAGGRPGMKISWQVTGIRKDAYAEQHRIPVEELKPPELRGAYLHPAVYGLPDSASVQSAMESAKGIRPQPMPPVIQGEASARPR